MELTGLLKNLTIVRTLIVDKGMARDKAGEVNTKRCLLELVQ